LGNGDGSSPDDGIYILLKEVLDNCIDEFVMGAGKIEVTIRTKRLTLEITVVEFLLGKSLT
jgi:topoisomerase-4 subunit B